MISSYRFGEVTIGDDRHTHDVIISADGVRSWWRKKGHAVCVDDVADAVGSIKPEVVVIGTGNSGRMAVPPETRQWLESRGVEVIVASTADACNIFNELCSSRRAAAALHLTC